MSTPIFPDLSGFGWNMRVAPRFNTLIQTVASGLEARQAMATLTRREWTLKYSYLRQVPGQAVPSQFELEILQGFYLAQFGPLLTFFFRDQFFNTVTNGFIATGDGARTGFQAQRFLVAGSGEAGSGTSYAEPVFGFDTRASYTYGAYTRPAGVMRQAYLNGAPVAADFAPETGIISFISPPGNGVSITATYSYLFRCRFSEDTIDFDNIMERIWELQNLKILQTRV